MWETLSGAVAPSKMMKDRRKTKDCSESEEKRKEEVKEKEILIGVLKCGAAIFSKLF